MTPHKTNSVEGECDCGATGCPDACVTMKPANIYDGYERREERDQALKEYEAQHRRPNRHERRKLAKEQEHDT